MKAAKRQAPIAAPLKPVLKAPAVAGALVSAAALSLPLALVPAASELSLPLGGVAVSEAEEDEPPVAEPLEEAETVDVARVVLALSEPLAEVAVAEVAELLAEVAVLVAEVAVVESSLPSPVSTLMLWYEPSEPSAQTYLSAFLTPLL